MIIKTAAFSEAVVFLLLNRSIKTNIAIIGAGQLGSRHLQGLKKAQAPMNIYVLDANNDSLKICEQRYNEIADNNLIGEIIFSKH